MVSICFQFELDLDRDVAERVAEFDGGYAVIDTRVPLLWSSNYVVIEPGSGVDTERALAIGDELLGGAGLAHRSLAFKDRGDAERLGPELKARGWDAANGVYMALGREPDHAADEVAVEVDPGSLTDHHREISRVEDDDEEVGLQLLERERRIGAIADGRWFAVERGDEIASKCVLFRRGGVAQVEAVSTVPRYRNAGLARSVILAAVAASREAGDELTFIAADAEGWPRQLYQRLGFDEVGTTAGYILKPKRPG